MCFELCGQLLHQKMLAVWYQPLQMTLKKKIESTSALIASTPKLQSSDMGKMIELMKLACNAPASQFAKSLQAKAGIINFQNRNFVFNCHILHIVLACASDAAPLLQLLLSLPNIQFQCKDDHNCSLLHYAALKYDEQVFIPLLKRGANALEKDQENNNCLHVACFSGNLQAVQFLNKHFPQLAKEVNKQLKTPAEIATEYKYYEAAQVLGTNIPKELQLSLLSPKFALVIANSDYTKNKLPSVAKDVTFIRPLLENHLKYHVTLHQDTKTMDDIRGAIEQFCSFVNKTTKTPASILFYYAGHGFEVNGKNYLMPTKGSFSSFNDTENLYLMQHAFKALIDDIPNCIKLFFIDACRSSTNKLVPIDKEIHFKTTNCFFGLSTSPGVVAIDQYTNDDKCSQFAEAFVTNFGQPQRLLSTAYMQVTNHVAKVSNNVQVPWCQSSLTMQVFL